MCKLCDKVNYKHGDAITTIISSDNKDKETYITSINDEGYYIINGNELNAIAGDPYCGTDSLIINFCPICGRKLEHKEDAE